MCLKSPLYTYNFKKLHHLFECVRKIPFDKKNKNQVEQNSSPKQRMKQPKENYVSRVLCPKIPDEKLAWNVSNIKNTQQLNEST